MVSSIFARSLRIVLMHILVKPSVDGRHVKMGKLLTPSNAKDIHRQSLVLASTTLRWPPRILSL